MFCDKLSNLFASESLLSAQDVRHCLGSHLEKQASGVTHS
jgi:hypothetical protein